MYIYINIYIHHLQRRMSRHPQKWPSGGSANGRACEWVQVRGSFKNYATSDLTAAKMTAAKEEFVSVYEFVVHLKITIATSDLTAAKMTAEKEEFVRVWGFVSHLKIRHKTSDLTAAKEEFESVCEFVGHLKITNKSSDLTVAKMTAAKEEFVRVYEFVAHLKITISTSETFNPEIFSFVKNNIWRGFEGVRTLLLLIDLRPLHTSSSP